MVYTSYFSSLKKFTYSAFFSPTYVERQFQGRNSEKTFFFDNPSESYKIQHFFDSQYYDHELNRESQLQRFLNNYFISLAIMVFLLLTDFNRFVF